MNQEINEQELEQLDKYFRAANYLSAGQLYLKDLSRGKTSKKILLVTGEPLPVKISFIRI